MVHIGCKPMWACVRWVMRDRTFLLGYLPGHPVPLNWLNAQHAPTMPALAAPLPKGLLRSFPPTTPSTEVERVEWDGIANHADAWADLATRALEPNAFLEPGFALPSVQHVPAARRPTFLLAGSNTPATGERRLIGLFAVHPPKAGGGEIMHFWSNPMMAAGAPLIDSAAGSEALEALQLYTARHFPGVETLVFPQINLQGPFARLLGAHCATHGLTARVFDRRSRAIVTNRSDSETFARSFTSAKKRKELRRQRRRLEDIGTLIYTSARTPDEVRLAMEKFLALEASGWKGGQSTALLSDPSTATFARTMVRNFARNGACRIDAFELDGKPIAMGIVLSAHDIAFYWKTAYDEAHARYSPGVLFSLEMTAQMIESGAHEIINSCAIPNHPMIDHIWRERMEMGDLAIASLNATPRRLAFALGRESARRRLRSAAKRAYYTLTRKHPR